MPNELSDEEFNQVVTDLASVNSQIGKLFLQSSTTESDAAHSALNLKMGRLVRRRSGLEQLLTLHWQNCNV